MITQNGKLGAGIGEPGAGKSGNGERGAVNGERAKKSFVGKVPYSTRCEASGVRFSFFAQTEVLMKKQAPGSLLRQGLESF